ncbi:MAG: hypothetical protein ABL879_09120 [Devosia sp.]
MLSFRTLLLASSCTLFLAGAAAAQDFIVNDRGADGGDGTLVTAPANGGDGGVQAIVVPQVEGDVLIDLRGGTGGNADPSGPFVQGGAGGEGGIAAIAVTGPIAGGLSIDLSGGDAGLDVDGGRTANGGAGGVMALSVASDIGKLPSGESIRIDLSAGRGGAVTGGIVALSVQDATLRGGILVVDPEVISIGISDSAVRGKIAVTGADVSVLSWVDVTIDKKALKAILANTGSGKGVINGARVSWEGFSSVTIGNYTLLVPDRRETASQQTPPRLGCNPGGVSALVEGETVVFNARGESGWFHVGDLVGDTFSSSNHSGWTVTVEAGGKEHLAKVWNGSAELVSTCRLAW